MLNTNQGICQRQTEMSGFLCCRFLQCNAIPIASIAVWHLTPRVIQCRFVFRIAPHNRLIHPRIHLLARGGQRLPQWLVQHRIVKFALFPPLIWKVLHAV